MPLDGLEPHCSAHEGSAASRNVIDRASVEPIHGAVTTERTC